MVVDPSLYNFIKEELAAGKSQEQISATLISQGGWTEADVQECFAALSPVTTSTPIKPLPPPSPSPLPAQPAPAPTLNSSSYQPSYEASQPRVRTSLIIGIIIAVIVVLVGGGLALAYFVIIPDFSQPSPQAVLAKTVAAMGNVTSFNYSASLQSSGVSEATSTETTIMISATSTGMVNIASTTNPNIDTHLNLAGNFDYVFGTSTYSGGITMGMEARIINQTGYFLINNFSFTSSNPLIAAIGGFVGGVVGQIENKWVFATSSPVGSPSTLTSTTPLTVAEKQALIARLQTLDFVNSIQQLSNASVNGVATYHYAVVIDPTKINTDVSETLGTTTAPSFSPKQSPITVDVWIGRKDDYLYQAELLQQSLSIQNTGHGTTTAMVMMNDFNQPVTIQVPAGAVSLQSVLQNVFSGLGVTPSVSAPKTPTPVPSKIK